MVKFRGVMSWIADKPTRTCQLWFDGAYIDPKNGEWLDTVDRVSR